MKQTVAPALEAVVWCGKYKRRLKFGDSPTGLSAEFCLDERPIELTISSRAGDFVLDAAIEQEIRCASVKLQRVPFPQRVCLIGRCVFTEHGTDNREIIKLFAAEPDSPELQFPQAEFGVTYINVLAAEIARLSPKRILEWGPGISTLLLAELCPQAQLLSIEHDLEWFAKMNGVKRYYHQLDVVHRAISLRPGASQGYATYPFLRSELFDLIFIDGRARCDCIAVASRKISPHGTVLVHDAHRRNYHPAFRLFRTVNIKDNTAVLRDPIEL